MSGKEKEMKMRAVTERQEECNNQAVGRLTIYLGSEGVEGDLKISGWEEKRRKEGEEGRPVCYNIAINETVK